MSFRKTRPGDEPPAQRWERHPLFVAPRIPYAQMSTREWHWWVYQNGEMFLARLPWWQRLAPLLGPGPAAEVLKRAQRPDQCYDAWVSRDPDWYPKTERRAEPERTPAGDSDKGTVFPDKGTLPEALPGGDGPQAP